MKQEQLKEPGHYRLSFRAALRYTLRARTDYFKDATSRVKFGDAAIFMPFIALVFGLALMVIAMISAVFMKNNFFASGAVVLFFIVFFLCGGRKRNCSQFYSNYSSKQLFYLQWVVGTEVLRLEDK